MLGDGMIIVIDALNKHRFGPVLKAMHRLRARVFRDRLGWDVTVIDDMEHDLFDNLHPAHVVCLDEDGDVVGCMRLLQTTGPHMLADVFADILDGEPPLRSARLWEATRFCVDTAKLGGGKARNSISYITSEVMIGAFEYAQKAGVLDAIAVIDPVMNRVLQRSGNAPYDYVGSTKQMGKVRAMAALMDCSDKRIAGIRAFAGIKHDVFASEEAVLLQFNPQVAPRAVANPAKQVGDLHAYFAEQLQAADSQTEMDAVHRLMNEIRDKLPPGPQKLPQTLH